MKTENDSSRHFRRALLVEYAVIGMVIALVMILFLILQVADPKPEWPGYWMIKPLIITPLVGAIGGVVYYFINNLNRNSAAKRILLSFVGIIVYLFILWVGIVLGLDGTLWN